MSPSVNEAPDHVVAPDFEPFLLPLQGTAEEVRAVVEPALRIQGLELVQLFLVRGSHRDQLRLFIDKKVRAAGGVAMAEIERASRVLSDLLDVEDKERGLFGKPYDLEVSSPGLDRPLTKKSHFGGAVGERIKVRADRPAAFGRSVTGKLTGADDAGITLEAEGHDAPLQIGWGDISGAHVIFRFDEPERPKKKHDKKGKHR